MAWKSLTRQLGLVTSPSPLGVAQEGGMVAAENCVIDAGGVIEPRRGFRKSTRSINNNPSSTLRFNWLHSSSVGATGSTEGMVLGHYGSGTSGGVRDSDTNGASLITAVDAPDERIRVKFCDAAERCYFTTSAGVKRIDSDASTSTVAQAGGLRASIDVTNTHPDPDSSGFLDPVTNSSGVAALYRALLVTKDAKGREIVGPPSNRCYVRVPPARTANTGGVVRSTNVTTVTTTAAHGFRWGDTVTMTFDPADTGAGEFTNGEKVITSVPSSTSFTYADAAADYISTAAATAAIGVSFAKPRILLPDAATVSTLVRLYRSEVAVASWTATPSEECYLVWEGYPSASDISNGYIVISDNTPEVVLGDVAYFAPSQEGDEGANEPPPLCWDVWKQGDVTFYGRVTYPHQMELRLLATGGSTGGAVSGDTVVFTRSGYTTLTITFGTSQAADQAVIYTGGTAARDVEATAIALCDAINASTTATWLEAEYVSTGDDAPGIILLRANSYATTAFTVTSANCAEAWSPEISSTKTAATSTQQVSPDGIAWSKPGQPDAVPLLNFARVGQPNRAFCRGMEARDKSIILKEDGAYLVSGTYPNFRIDLIDDSAAFGLPDTAASLGGQVYAVSSLGVVAVSEGGIAILSSPIDEELKALASKYVNTDTGAFQVAALAWGCGDVKENRYLLGVPDKLDIAYLGTNFPAPIESVYVFNATAKAWTRWAGTWRHMVRRRGSSLVAALSDAPGITRQNADLGIDDPRTYYDDSNRDFYVYAKSGTTLTLQETDSNGAFNVGGVRVGDAVNGATITAVSVSDSTVTVVDASEIDIGDTVSHQEAYEASVEWVPVALGGPAHSQANTVMLHMDKQRFYAASVYVRSELDQSLRLAKSLSRYGYGQQAFGQFQFGDYNGMREERCAVPANSQRAALHSVRFVCDEAGAYWRIHGMHLGFNAQSEKGQR